MPPEGRLRLARKARLKWDRHAQRHMLLYPERGLALNEVAAAILALCDGAHTARDITLELARRAGKSPGDIEAEVAEFLDTMRTKGLVAVEES